EIKWLDMFPDRIVVNPKILGGKPVIKGTRIPVYIILQMLRDGASFEKILKEYPRLSVEDLRAVLDYSMYLIDPGNEEEIPLSQEP
ncbi:MAG: DUF433 domain-containing protein, partial [bacterium]